MKLLERSLVLIPVLVVAFVIYFFAHGLDPDSVFCFYKIYKQPHGSYEVWWSCNYRHLEQTFETYEQAKAFQVQQCRSLRAFMWQKPHGERVK